MNKQQKPLFERWQEDNNEIVFLKKEENKSMNNDKLEEAEAMKYFNTGDE